MKRWSQDISLTWRDPAKLTAIVPPGSSDVVRVNVDVKYDGETVFSTNWLVARREQ